jgi:hypothetical protein
MAGPENDTTTKKSPAAVAGLKVNEHDDNGTACAPTQQRCF